MHLPINNMPKATWLLGSQVSCRLTTMAPLPSGCAADTSGAPKFRPAASAVHDGELIDRKRATGCQDAHSTPAGTSVLLPGPAQLLTPKAVHRPTPQPTNSAVEC